MLRGLLNSQNDPGWGGVMGSWLKSVTEWKQKHYEHVCGGYIWDLWMYQLSVCRTHICSQNYAYTTPVTEGFAVYELFLGSFIFEKPEWLRSNKAYFRQIPVATQQEKKPFSKCLRQQNEKNCAFWQFCIHLHSFWSMLTRLPLTPNLLV